MPVAVLPTVVCVGGSVGRESRVGLPRAKHVNGAVSSCFRSQVHFMDRACGGVLLVQLHLRAVPPYMVVVNSSS